MGNLFTRIDTVLLQVNDPNRALDWIGRYALGLLRKHEDFSGNCKQACLAR